MGDVEEGAEVDDEIEAGIGERQLSRVTKDERYGLRQLSPRLAEGLRIDVDADQRLRREVGSEVGERDAAAAADLEDASASRQAESGLQQGKLGPTLGEVLVGQAGEGAVLARPIVRMRSTMSTKRHVQLLSSAAQQSL